MRTLRLTEYTSSFAIPLTNEERDALRSIIKSLTIAPTPGQDDQYDLTPAATVGVLRVGDLQVEIAPRLPVERVLFLVSYALDPRKWMEDPTAVTPDAHLLEAIVPTFVHHVRVALRRGLLHGYRSLEETGTTVRGRIRLSDQLRVRPGRHVPLELVHDDFTADILENQLLLAATERLLRLRLRNPQSRSSLLGVREQLTSVSSVSFPAGRVPEPRWTRLNERYRPAVSLARLVLSGAAVDLSDGPVQATGVLFDMAAVFENFVVAALREALGLSMRAFPQGGARLHLRLDEEGGIPLKPDLSWWIGGACVFVGDCKYKRAVVAGVPNADLYQLLAYTTALDLEEGLLVYAAGEHPPSAHTVKHAGKRLRVATLDLAGDPSAVLAEIDALARQIRRLARRKLRPSAA